MPQRDLRDLTRQRTNLVHERATVVNRLQKVLEWANIKLGSVVSDIMGVSARAMLQALAGGETDPAVITDTARGQVRKKRAVLEEALTGHVRAHHRFLISQHLIHLDFLEEQHACFDAHIDTLIRTAAVPDTDTEAPNARPNVSTAAPYNVGEPPPLAWAQASTLPQTIPGVVRTTAKLLLAEVGTNMQRFPNAAHLASWDTVAPGNHESAGKRYSGRTGHGDRMLLRHEPYRVLVQPPWTSNRR